MKAVLWVCVVAAVAACSESIKPSSSGVDSSKKIAQLTPVERTQLCAFALELVGETRTKTCNGTAITVMVKGTCDEDTTKVSDDCAATVGQAEGCFKAIDADLCNAVSECAALSQCAPQMTPRLGS